MARRNLPQACLLDVSGELGEKAQQQLNEHLKQSPEAQLEYERIKAQMALLQSLPKPNLTPEQKKQISDEIKQGIHQTLRQQHRQLAKAQRWRLASPALAGAFALAACLIIVCSVGYVLNAAETNRKAAVAKAEQSLRDYIDADSSNLTDVAYHDVDDEINAAEEEPRGLNAEVSGDSMQKLLDDLDGTPGADRQTLQRGTL